MLFQVYKALVESHLRYADVVWGSLSNTKITTLQKLQNHAFEIIQGSKIKDSLIRPTFTIDQMFQFDRSVLQGNPCVRWFKATKAQKILLLGVFSLPSINQSINQSIYLSTYLPIIKYNLKAKLHTPYFILGLNRIESAIKNSE